MNKNILTNVFTTVISGGVLGLLAFAYTTLETINKGLHTIDNLVVQLEQLNEEAKLYRSTNDIRFNNLDKEVAKIKQAISME